MSTAAASVAVIGGGLSGLTAAYRLERAGVPVVVLECSGRLGGRVRSIRLGDCIVDTGAVGMLGSYANMASLANEIGLADQLSKKPVRLAIPRSGQQHVLDMGRLSTVLGTDLLSVASKWKLRKLLIPMIRLWSRMDFESMAKLASADTETVGSFAKRELNPELYEYLVSPIIRALWQRDASGTPVVDLFCSLKIFAPTMYGLTGGLQRLPDVLAHGLHTQISSRVVAVEETQTGVLITYEREGRIRSEVFSQAVVAVSPGVVTEIVRPLPVEMASALARQEYSCSVNVHFSLKKRIGGDVLVVFPPETEAPDLTTAVYEHNKGVDRAPPDKGAISLYWRDSWSRAQMKRPDASVVVDALQQASAVIPGLEAGIIEASHVERWPLSGVCRSVGGTADLGEIERGASTFKRIAFAGDYFVLSGMNAAIVSGEKAARTILAMRAAPIFGDQRR